MASHSARLSLKLGQNMPGKPRRSISLAMSRMAVRRPGTAARLTAGNWLIILPLLTDQLFVVQDWLMSGELAT
jgi:hypothetical protein